MKQMVEELAISRSHLSNMKSKTKKNMKQIVEELAIQSLK